MCDVRYIPVFYLASQAKDLFGKFIEICYGLFFEFGISSGLKNPSFPKGIPFYHLKTAFAVGVRWQEATSCGSSKRLCHCGRRCLRLIVW